MYMYVCVGMGTTLALAVSFSNPFFPPFSLCSWQVYPMPMYEAPTLCTAPVPGSQMHPESYTRAML